MEHTEDFIKSLQIPLEVLDDLASRFILNMPNEEKYDPIRIFFQIEIAFWHYLDFCRVFNSNLPKFKFKKFAQVMFNYVPRLRQYLDRFDEIINEWIQYKQSIPCSGAIMIDKALEHILLVQGFGNNNWGFPKGKVNHDESLSNCAIREVSEETGYNCIVDESQFLERKVFDSPLRLYLIKNVDFDFNFKPQARNEIRSIKWFPLKEFARICKSNKYNTNNVMIQNSSKFSSVIPFIPSILKWVKNEKRKLKISRRQDLKSQNEGNIDEKAITILMNAKRARSNIIEELEAEEELNLSSLESNSHNVSNKDHSTSFVDVDLKSIFGFDDSNIFNDTDNHKDNVNESDIVTYQSKWNSINADYNRMINEKKTNNINDIFTLTTPFNNYLVTPVTSKLPQAGTLEDIERELIHPTNKNKAPTNKVSNVNTLLDANVSCDEKLNALFGLAQNNFPIQNGVDETMISNNRLSFSGDNNNHYNHREFTKNDLSPRKANQLAPIGTKRFSINDDQLKKNIDKNNTVVKHSGQTVISNNHSNNDKTTNVEQLMIKSSLNLNMNRNNQTYSFANDNITPSTTAALNSLFNLSKQSPIVIPNCSVMNIDYSKRDNSNCFNGLESETIINVHPKIELLLQRLKVINN